MREFLPAWVGEAIAEARLQPADRPSVDFEIGARRGRAVHVHGRVPAAPEGHAARRSSSSRACRRRSRSPPRRSTPSSSGCARSPRRSSTVERAAQTGDYVEVDMHVSANGKPVPEASTVGYLVQLGTGRTFEEIERALRGMTAGETRHDRSCRCRPTTPTPKLRGRNADVELHVHSRARAPAAPARRRVRARRVRVRHARRAARRDRGALPRAARGARALALPRQRARHRSARPSRSSCRRTSWPAASRS